MGVWKMVKTVLWFELLWRLAFLCLVNPLFNGLFHAYVSAAGLSLNGGIVWAFLHPVGAAVFLLLFLPRPGWCSMSTALSSAPPPCAARGRASPWARP